MPQGKNKEKLKRENHLPDVLEVSKRDLSLGLAERLEKNEGSSSELKGT